MPKACGYDQPWRQVHALLQLAAERTPNVRKEPKPTVVQRALGDFAVQYELRAHIDDAVDRAHAISTCTPRSRTRSTSSACGSCRRRSRASPTAPFAAGGGRPRGLILERVGATPAPHAIEASAIAPRSHSAIATDTG